MYKNLCVLLFSLPSPFSIIEFNLTISILTTASLLALGKSIFYQCPNCRYQVPKIWSKKWRLLKLNLYYRIKKGLVVIGPNIGCSQSGSSKDKRIYCLSCPRDLICSSFGHMTHGPTAHAQPQVLCMRRLTKWDTWWDRPSAHARTLKKYFPVP